MAREVKEPSEFDSWVDKLAGTDPTVRAIVNEGGDLSAVYRSKYGLLPEVLNPPAFRVESSQLAQILEDDSQLNEGFDSFSFKRQKGDYMIVDIGHSHLPGVAHRMVALDIDCYFVIPEAINERFHETLKYWAVDYDNKKRRMNDPPQGCATLIDVHRSDGVPRYNLSSEHFPSAERLKELGITRLVYLNESSVGFFTPDFPDDLKPIFEAYQEAGLEIVAFGIDSRQGFRDRS